MLGNQDFAKLVASNEQIVRDKGDKVRFDIKQITKWDKEIKGKHDKKTANKESVEITAAAKVKNHQVDKYRDRALERRKEVHKEDEQKFEEIVSKLDAEQTKFLGGDVEHTHLVKGLDYALLQKMRKEKDEGNEQEEAMDVESHSAVSDGVLETSTAFGSKMKKFFFQKSKMTERADMGDVLSRIFFEFDIEPDHDDLESVDYVPLTVSKSRKDVLVHTEEYSHYSIEKHLIQSICSLFESGKLVAKHRKKKRPREGTVPLVPVVVAGTGPVVVAGTGPVPPPPRPPLFASPKAIPARAPGGSADKNKASIYDDMDIYGSDVVVGKYVPAGMEVEVEGEEKEKKTTNNEEKIVSGESGQSAEERNKTVRGIFGSSPSNRVGSDDASRDKEALMKPVQTLLSAQANRERAAKERERQKVENLKMGVGVDANRTKAATSNCMVVETDSSGNTLVHRDIFASTKDKVVTAHSIEKKGDAFGLHGDYDTHMNTTHYEDIYNDSDEEDPNDKLRSLNSLAMEGAEDEGSAVGGTSSNKLNIGAFGGDTAATSGSYFGISKDPAAGKGADRVGFSSKKFKGSSTPWSRSGTSSSVGMSSKTPKDNNRAARRQANHKQLKTNDQQIK